jgi:hypothetical protein
MDNRLDVVLEKLTNSISEQQTLSLRKLSSSRKEEIQFGRFVGNKKVSVEILEQELYTQMQNNCISSHCLLIEDTSKIGFSLERAIAGLGKVDKGQIKGFYIHPVLAIDAVNYGCYGIASLEFVTRPFADEALTHRQISTIRSMTPFEEKESYRWFNGIKKALPQCSNATRKTVVADREADIYPLLTSLTEELRVDYVIRSRFDRGTTSGSSILKEVASWSEESRYQIKVPATDKRSAHTAKMVVKYGQVELKKSANKTLRQQAGTHTTYVVEVKELPESVVNNEQPIHWILMTSHKVETVEMALQIVEWYKQRWNVEQIFRTLKSKGLKIESSQLKDYEKLQKLTILALIAAVKVMQLIKARDGSTGQTIASVFTQDEQEFMLLINQQVEGKTDKLRNPYSKNSLAYAAWVIARLAGWSGYASQRPAGPIDFLIGLQRFNERFEGFKIAKMNYKDVYIL